MEILLDFIKQNWFTALYVFTMFECIVFFVSIFVGAVSKGMAEFDGFLSHNGIVYPSLVFQIYYLSHHFGLI